MTRARRPRGRARVVRGGESCEDNFYRAFVALMGTRRRERAREGTVNANEACAREKGILTDECRRGSRANPRRRYTPRT